MSKRPIDADLGMLTMRLGETADGAGATPLLCPANQDDVSKLGAILSPQPNRRQPGHGSREQPTPMELIASRDVEGGERARQLCSEIALLWSGDGSQSRREVRIKLRREILPDTWLRLHESEGRLHIEMTAGSEGTRRWLASELRRLAGMLGERMDQPFRLVVIEEQASACVTLDWPEGRQA